VNNVCQAGTSPLIFQLQLNSFSLPLIDSVGHVKVEVLDALPIPAYYRQGWLFDGMIYHLRLPSERNLALASTHSVELWVRPTATSSLSCLFSKSTDTVSLLRFCVLASGLLQFDFAVTSLSDASVVSKSISGGQVSIGRVWTAVGYQLAFSRQTNSTVATLTVGKNSVASITLDGFIYADAIGNVIVGASGFSTAFFNGHIAEISLYNGQPSSVSGSCACAQCSSGSMCLSQCLSSEYLSSTECVPCNSSCTKGCLRSSDCRANLDPLCTNFTSFESCKGCGDLSEMTGNGCKCVSNASPKANLAACQCTSDSQSGDKCGVCQAYFTPEQVTAYFDSSFRQVIVDFSRPVVVGKVAVCDTFFLPSTLALLGSGCFCAWENRNTKMRVELGANSTLSNTTLALNYLQLYTTQGNCSTAVPLLPVATYPNTLPIPIVRLTAPKTYSLACSSALVLDASETKGGKGRGLNFLWRLTSDPVLPAISQYQSYNTTQPILTLPNALLSTTQLTVSLAVTNFLGAVSAIVAQVSVTSKANIGLMVDGGAQITTTASERTVVRVNPGAMCGESLSVDYVWTFVKAIPEQQGGNYTFLTSPSPPNRIRIPPYTLSPGVSYTFQVVISNTLYNGSAFFTIDVQRSPLVVSLNRTDSEVAATRPLAISGAESYDPEKAAGALGYLWSCWEGGSVCVDSQGGLVVNGKSGAILRIQPNQMRVGATWNLTLVISKDTRSASKSILLSIKNSTAADLTQASVPTRVNPQSALALVFTVAADQSTSFLWTQTQGSALDLLTPLTWPFLVVASDSMQSGSTYAFALKAENRQGSVTAQVAFSANFGPSGGVSRITPKTGQALSTVFTQENSQWEDREGDYPLSYSLAYTHKDREVAISGRRLSSSLLLKAGPGLYSLTAYVYDALNTFVAVPLPALAVSTARRLQSSDVLASFLQDTIDVDRTFEMVRAYSLTYHFDKQTFWGVFTALQTYVSQIETLDFKDLDACLSSIEALFLQTDQMNTQTLGSLLSFLTSALSRSQSRLSAAQLEQAAALSGEYPGQSSEEQTQLLRFLDGLLANVTAGAWPDQSAVVLASRVGEVYARRLSRGTISGLWADTGSSAVAFPSEFGIALGLTEGEVVDLHISSAAFPNTTSDQVTLSLLRAGNFTSYSFQPTSNPSPLALPSLTQPLQVSFPVRMLQSNETYVCVSMGRDGLWSAEGTNLSVLTDNTATCEVYILGTFKVIPKLGSTPEPVPSVVDSEIESCGANYAPVAIVIALIVLGLVASIVFRVKDARNEYREISKVGASVEMNFTGLKGPQNFESLPEKVFDTDKITSPTSHSTPANPHSKLSFRLLLLESHSLIGLFIHSPELKRWAKSLCWTAVLACEMTFIGARYEWEEGEYGQGSQASVWTGYSGRDFTHCLSALGVGIGVSLVLISGFTVAGKASISVKRVLNRVTAVLAGAVLGVALAGTIYLAMGLCFEQAGRWTVSFLPLFLGEVMLCQPLVAFSRAGLLKLIA